MRNPNLVLAALAGSVLSLSSASGALFSFAANGQEVPEFTPHFTGLGDTIDSLRVPITLWIEDDNGPLPPASFDTFFYSDFSLTHLGSDDFTSSLGYFEHNYALNGSFELGFGLITVTVENALMTARGEQDTWFSTATMQGGDFGDNNNVTYTISQRAIDLFEQSGIDTASYGLFAGSSVGLDDFGFALSSIQPLGTEGVTNAGVQLGSGALPFDWEAQASFTGAAFFVPAPGAVSVLTLGGLAAARRRR